MCGIVGFVGEGSAETLSLMRAAILHRGPDDDGAWSGEAGGRLIRLGFRRLAILDIATGAQPMVSADDRIAVVFNGQIYNHRALRRELEALGHVFRSDHADTEVLIHGYRQWGEGMVERLDGMFAFALLDREEARLLLGRDPYGKKPFFYARTAKGIVFGSEIRAVLLHPEFTGALEPRALRRYFAFGYVPAPDTLYAGVKKLPGGHCATYDIATRKIDVRRFWRYRIRVGEVPQGGPDDWASEIRLRLEQAVTKRLESDVPLGFFLSGGVDSTAVVALARQSLGTKPIETFSIGFSDHRFDESEAAAFVADRFGTRHHKRVLDLDQAAGMVGNLLRRIDEPNADDAVVPTYLLSAVAREQVTVALSGDGGDELFAGYDTFPALGLASLYARIVPSWAHDLIRRVVERLPSSTGRLSLEFKLRRALRGLGHQPGAWHPAWIGPLPPEDVNALCRSNEAPEELYADAIALWRSCSSDNDVDRALEFFATYYLQDDILSKVDRASMLNSLEVRCPFLDKNLADYVMRLPADAKMRNGERKWILKRALEGIVPREILERKKQGFSVPLLDWLKVLPPPDMKFAEDIGLDADWLARAQADHRAGRADHRGVLWAWHCLEGSVKGNAEAVVSARKALPEGAA